MNLKTIPIPIAIGIGIVFIVRYAHKPVFCSRNG